MRKHSFNAKPKPRFYGKDDYFLGIELEMEAPSYAAHNSGLEFSKRPGYMYAKHDGSLNEYGMELVTHPISRTYWLSKSRRTPVVRFMEHVAHCRDELNYNSHNGGRCGLHVHVSWSAFRGCVPFRTPPYCTHLYWFKRLVVTSEFLALAQRERSQLDRWAKPREVCATSFWERNHERYCALNHTNHTLEVRIFRGNMREERIRKAVEAVIAGVEYTRGLSSSDFNKPLYAGFAEYVISKKDKYPNLHSYLGEIGQIKRTEDSAIEFAPGGETETMALEVAEACA